MRKAKTVEKELNSGESLGTLPELFKLKEPVAVSSTNPNSNPNTEGGISIEEWLQTPLVKATYLCTKYSYHESIVDSFVDRRLGFYDGWLYPFPQLSLPLRYSAATPWRITATADFAIMHVLLFYCMAVVKDKCVNNDMVNSGPQLIAEAIAMSQANGEVLTTYRLEVKNLRQALPFSDAARIGYWMCA